MNWIINRAVRDLLDKKYKCETTISIFFGVSIWRPSSLSELTPMIFNMGLTHLGSKASNCSNASHINLHEILLLKINLKFSIEKQNIYGIYA